MIDPTNGEFPCICVGEYVDEGEVLEGLEFDLGEVVLPTAIFFYEDSGTDETDKGETHSSRNDSKGRTNPE